LNTNLQGNKSTIKTSKRAFGERSVQGKNKENRHERGGLKENGRPRTTTQRPSLPLGKRGHENAE